MIFFSLLLYFFFAFPGLFLMVKFISEPEDPIDNSRSAVDTVRAATTVDADSTQKDWQNGRHAKACNVIND